MENALSADAVGVNDAFPGAGRILSAGTDAALGSAGVLFGVWAVCSLPPQVLGLALGAATGAQDREVLKQAVVSLDWSVLGPLAAVGIVGMVLSLLGYTATILVTARAHQGRPVGIGEALADAAGRMFSAAGASLAAGLAVLTASVALILPGLYLVVRLSPAVCATVVEEVGPLASVSRGWALTRGHFWDVLICLVAFVALGLVGVAVLVAAGLLLRAAASAAGPAGTALSGLVLNAGQFFVSAWITACMTKLFLELASRRPRAA